MFWVTETAELLTLKGGLAGLFVRPRLLKSTLYRMPSALLFLTWLLPINFSPLPIPVCTCGFFSAYYVYFNNVALLPIYFFVSSAFLKVGGKDLAVVS